MLVFGMEESRAVSFELHTPVTEVGNMEFLLRNSDGALKVFWFWFQSWEEDEPKYWMHSTT